MSIRENLARVREHIAKACESCGRDPREIRLVAVTKTVDIARIREAYDCGLRLFGESRLQEALPKLEALPSDVEWHFIGKLQSNKARKAAELFDAIHTLESASQIVELDKAQRDAPLDALIEVNIAGEPQKSGVWEGGLDSLVQLVLRSNQVRLRGLMTVGPLCDEPEAMRPFFRRLRELNGRVPNADWLSMGMSGDYEVAIQEGATHIRVGTALFGERT